MSFEELRKHLMDFYGDTSRPAEETKDKLEELVEEINTLIETL